MTDPPALVAILDVEEKLRLALARLLKAHGYAVTGFATGEALLAALAERRFDCTLLDLSMPGMSGFDVLATLQALAQPPPVIVDWERKQWAVPINATASKVTKVGDPAG